MSETRVLVLVGSLRQASVNRQIAEAAATVARDGVNVEIFGGLGAIPFYNEDLESPAPATAQALRDAVEQADAVLFVTPEYNGTIPAVLKNAIDWVSRPYGAGAIKGKASAVISSSISPYGAKWAAADVVRSLGVAGAQVIGDVTLSLGPVGQLLGEQHPREVAEVRDQVGAVVEALANGARELIAA